MSMSGATERHRLPSLLSESSVTSLEWPSFFSLPEVVAWATSHRRMSRLAESAWRPVASTWQAKQPEKVGHLAMTTGNRPRRSHTSMQSSSAPETATAPSAATVK
eukprot:6270184-Pyramimonas_sp.AAC.1